MVRRALLTALAAALPLSVGGTDINPPQLDRRFGEGCWVRFFEAPDFGQPLGRLAGALYVNSFARPGLIGRMSEAEFFGRSRSLVVGPEARLIAYAEPGFREELFALEPGREVKDLNALGFPKKAASLKIVCDYR